MEPEKAVQLVWSDNGEDFNGDSLCELIENSELQPGQTVHFGEAKYHSTSWIDANDVIEIISDRAWDEGGEYAEDFPNVSDQAKKELGDFLEKWQSEHCIPHFYRVINIQQHVITEEEYTEAQS